MYHVHAKRLTSSQLRLHLAEALDTAERGESVVIERRGTRFLLRVAPVNSRPRHAGRRIIDIVDPAVADGEMDVVLARWKPRVPRSPAAAVILLDTNTLTGSPTRCASGPRPCARVRLACEPARTAAAGACAAGLPGVWSFRSLPATKRSALSIAVSVPANIPGRHKMLSSTFYDLC